MDQYCVMGNPVEHSRSPWIHARFAELTGQALHYGRRLVPLGGFEEAVAAFAPRPAARRAAATSPSRSSSMPPAWPDTRARGPRWPAR